MEISSFGFHMMRLQLLRHMRYAGSRNVFVQAGCVQNTFQSLSVHTASNCNRDGVFNIRFYYHRVT
jgi:hypothetical protein